MTAMDMARAERSALADLLEELSGDQWNSPTLCERWRVRDVVAHIISYDDVGGMELLQQFVKGRLNIDRINQNAIADSAKRSPEQLRDDFLSHLEPRGLATGFGGRIALTDNMIHHQDIRRPLGMPRPIPTERLKVALSFALYAPTLRGAWLARGVRLVADDLDWTHGRGPEVTGSGEALLMAMAGREAALDDLSGPGLARLSPRL